MSATPTMTGTFESPVIARSASMSVAPSVRPNTLKEVVGGVNRGLTWESRTLAVGCKDGVYVLLFLSYTNDCYVLFIHIRSY